MKAIVHHAYGGPEVLELVDVGADVAGVVEAVGENVKDFEPGDEVFGGRAGAFGICTSCGNLSSPAR